MKETTNAKMKLPEYTDPVDIADINGNFEIIDQYFGVIGSGGSDNIFIAEYGTTTFEEIKTAWNNGKACFCKMKNDTTLSENRLCSLCYISDTYIYFGVSYGKTNYRFSVGTNNAWSSSTFSLQGANLTTTITESSTNTNYPSAKAVYTFVTGLIGNIETVAAEIDTLIGE